MAVHPAARDVRTALNRQATGNQAPEASTHNTHHAIDIAKTPEALNVPGFDFHGLQGKPKRYSVHVNGPWCITFEWQGEKAVKLDFENYH